MMSSSPLASLQQEMSWNPAQLAVDLQAATQLLTDRGWKLAAKFAAELWMGLPVVTATDNEGLTPQDIDPALLAANHKPRPALLAYAQTLMDLGEYAHAAAVLSQPHATVERLPPPLPDLTAAAIALRAYAMYMAGERRKEEAHQENEG